MLALFDSLVDQAQQHHHRQLLILSGSEQWCYQQCQTIYTAHKQRFSDGMVLSNSLIGYIPSRAIADSFHVIGQEFSLVLFNGFDGINSNAIAASMGTLKGGGVYVLLLPSRSRLAQFNDPDKQRIAADYGNADQVNQSQSHFLVRLNSLLNNHYGICVAEEHLPLPEIVQPGSPLTADQRPIFQQEQQGVVEQILALSHGHRHRPLVISADRGRGKSASLGIAAAKMLVETRRKIVVTAPSPLAVQSVFKHCALSAGKPWDESKIMTQLVINDSSLSYVAPDALHQSHDAADMLFVDEAAAIPNTLLISFLANHARIVFATTEHGYEGCGLGFSIRFKAHLDQHCPGWQQVNLRHPARWNNNDPLEAWCAKLFKLNAQITRLGPTLRTKNAKFHLVNSADLLRNEALLNDVFALLINAHYQTSPDDLRSLLDHPYQRIFIARQHGTVVGVILGHLEHIPSAELRDAVWRNSRRLRGLLLPQLLAPQLSAPQLLAKRFYRIVRIATHPDCQRQRIASSLLNYCQKHLCEDTDYIGASFGSHPDLIRFWKRNGFSGLHIGVKRNAASGETAVVFLKNIHASEDKSFEQLQAQQLMRLRCRMPVFHRELNTECIRLFFYNAIPNHYMRLTAITKSALKLFCQGLRQPDAIFDDLQKLYWHKLLTGSNALLEDEHRLLIDFLLLQKDSKETQKALKLTGQKAWLQALRCSTEKLLDNSTYTEV